ncbi:hypothetical protein MM213_20540 [Belliella sp. R4-6]|uniref:Uncharacterized protein n=1 Tax=Belliella alkalica TaxID=1730871 RepID=A0ABS9VHM4_9BACT|nr:hypothetical protein [Belliella alkalica]MCH7415901.1 hypothetical protein [Belliella alkalica]
MKALTLIQIIILLVSSPTPVFDKEVQEVFILVERNADVRSRIYYLEKDMHHSVRINFDTPNYSAHMMHISSKANHFNYSHEEIEISKKEMINSKVLFAEKLTFMEWSELEQIGLNQKIYMIFQEDYLSKERFVLNHKFKALEVRVTVDGPI